MTPFEQAFALRTLLLGTQESAEVSWILGELTRTQRADGSWSPSARLRIPPPDMIEPDAYNGWVEGGRGGGSIQSDWNACFTTAAVLQALVAAEQHSLCHERRVLNIMRVRDMSVPLGSLAAID